MRTIIVLAAFVPLLLQAQSFSMANKKPGYLVTGDDTIQGEIAINFSSNQILLVNENGINNIPARDVKKIVIEDGPDKIYKTAILSEDKVFVEVLSDGELALCHRNVEDKEIFYVVGEDGQAESVSPGKKLFDAFGDFKKQMKDYAFSANIDPETKSGMIEIFRYYNATYL